MTLILSNLKAGLARETMMIYTHVLNRGGKDSNGPADVVVPV